MGSDRQNLPRAQRRLLRRRKWTVATVVGVTFFFLLFYNLASYLFLQRIGRQLEESLDQRLAVTASLTAELVELGLNSFTDAGEAEILRGTLNRIRLEHELEAAYLVGPDGRILLDARRELENNIGRPYLMEDSLAIRAAFAGEVRASRLHTVAGNHFKSVYAPLSDVYGNDAVLALEASAGFLRTMAQFRRALYIGVIISLLLLAALALFLVLAMLQFLRTETRLYRSERLASLGQMAATVAHEIRNPLAIIKSTADVLREKPLPPAKSAEFFNYIDEEIVRLNRIVGDFLAYSREPRLEMARHDLVPLLQELADGFSRQGRRVELQCAEPQIHLRCDAGQIGQVLLNLLLNAQQAMEGRGEGAIILRLRKHSARGRSQVIIEVQDSGPGLPGRGRDIFEPFFTTRSSGTGLGLAVSKRIVEGHGGEIKALEPREGGTLMRMIFPEHGGQGE